MKRQCDRTLRRQVEHEWQSSLTAFCHAPDVVGGLGALVKRAPPDAMLARGTVCGFDGSLVLVHWDLVQNLRPSCGAEQVGLGRIAASEREAPTLLVNLV